MRWLLSISLVVSLTVAVPADDDGRIAYIDCAGDKHGFVALYADPCDIEPVANLRCGDKVRPVRREGRWVKIASGGRDRYVDALSISQNKKEFLQLQVPIAPAPNCPKPELPPGHARATYAPDPEYTEEARKAKIQGSVVLKLVVEPDGTTHDITVVKAIGHGLDENAVKTIRTWKWEPALENGKPKASEVTVTMTFNVY